MHWRKAEAMVVEKPCRTSGGGGPGALPHPGQSFLNLQLMSLLLSLMITFKEMTPRSLRKTFLGYKTGRRLFKRFTYHRAEKEFTVMSRLKEML